MSLHEQIASPDYWEDTQPLPKIPLDKGMVDGFFSVHHMAARGAAQIMQLYKKAGTKGFISEHISVGEELPSLEKGDGLLRLVEDLVYPVGPLSFISRSKNQSGEVFDEIAAQMEEEKLYYGDSARTIVNIEANRRAHIWRIVSYMTGSKSGHMLDGLLSSELRLRPEQIPMLHQLPLLTVGQAYSRNKQETKLLKVVSAEVLIPGGGKRKRAPARAKVKPTPRLAFNP